MSTNKQRKVGKLLTNIEAAEFLGLHPISLSNMRVRGYGPTYIKSGRWVRYEEHKLVEWINRRTVVVVPENERVA